MKVNNKLVGILITTFIIIFAIVFTWGLISTRNDQKKEIENIITAHGGKLIKIETTDGSKSPFVGEVTSYNTIYKITYEKSGQQFVAWYRAVNVVNDIHNKNPSHTGTGGYSEKWIFQEG
jgi:heme/copper-type cytochrome/quinol oxidase subunit 2